MGYERTNIAAMAGYSYGEQPEAESVIKLNTNENPYPPSPAVQQALSSADANALRIYPSATAPELRSAIAALHQLDADQVVLTHGGDEALRLAMTTFVGENQGFGMAEPSYSLYPVLAAVADANIHRVDLDDNWHWPPQGSESLNRAGVKLTCIVNPHAPSGTLATVPELSALATALDGVLLVDEAYADFIDPDQGYDSSKLIKDHDNVLILRTFSKGYSLAGLRLGYLLGARDLISAIAEKTRDSYNIDGLSQLLGAASIGDQAYARQTWDEVRRARVALLAGLTQLGFSAPASHANFLLCEVPDASSAQAQALYQGLRERHIYVRYFDAPRLRNKLRITVGTQEQNQSLIAALQQLLQAPT
ncbi:MAG: histidinol-phosphate transaminase [Pseudomonadales bacterium]